MPLILIKIGWMHYRHLRGRFFKVQSPLVNASLKSE
ncbi:hypothetical protein ACP70R_003435 [Stipagrostis hirtigluma subsp. patula]